MNRMINEWIVTNTHHVDIGAGVVADETCTPLVKVEAIETEKQLEEFKIRFGVECSRLIVTRTVVQASLRYLSHGR